MSGSFYSVCVTCCVFSKHCISTAGISAHSAIYASPLIRHNASDTLPFAASLKVSVFGEVALVGLQFRSLQYLNSTLTKLRDSGTER
jgi:hypothetical protein